jgi:hypothetical protein
MADLDRRIMRRFLHAGVTVPALGAPNAGFPLAETRTVPAYPDEPFWLVFTVKEARDERR